MMDTKEISISENSPGLLSGLISLFGVEAIHCYSQCWDTENFEITIVAGGGVNKEIKNEITTLARQLFTQAFNNHLIDEEQEDTEFWSGTIRLSGQAGNTACLEVCVAYYYNDTEDHGATMLISPGEEAYSFIQDHNIGSFEFRYDGGGDSGGMESFDALDKHGNPLSQLQSDNLCDLLESSIYSRTEPCFDGNGSFGSGSCDCTQVDDAGNYQVHLEYGHYVTETKEHVDSYPV